MPSLESFIHSGVVAVPTLADASNRSRVGSTFIERILLPTAEVLFSI